MNYIESLPYFDLLQLKKYLENLPSHLRIEQILPEVEYFIGNKTFPITVELTTVEVDGD